ncbi:YlbF family regulator [uncultured Enterococcus sp.]|uniref:YlbF family regulator n=1 Tax=uncultured Enterococcus sp. TaxID=167972 RepID=UPI0025DA0B3C|nr:YlbF family regulator [uncultured Enterococcus sp.]
MEESIQKELEILEQLIASHPIIREFKEVQLRAQNNTALKELEAQIKRAQKDAVQYAHYDKPEAEKIAIKEIEQLQATYDQHPLVVRYRDVLYEANELLQYVTTTLQKKVNHVIEEEPLDASKD